MSSWTSCIVVLGILMIPVQLLAAQKMKLDIDGGYRDFAEKHGRETASTAALILFLLVAFGSAFMFDSDMMKFTNYYPFKPVYLFVSNSAWLAVPSDRPELKSAYIIIWRVITCVVPGLVYVYFNSWVSGFVYESLRKKR